MISKGRLEKDISLQFFQVIRTFKSMQYLK